MDYPAEIATFTVTGKLMYGNPDTDDAGIAPDLEPVRGASILFEPEREPAIFDAPAAATVIYQRAVQASTDYNGQITGVFDSTADVMLPYYPGQTWRVTIQVPDFPTQVFSITGSAGGTVNIASVVPVPPDPGTDIIAWEAVVSEVTDARDDAVAAAVAAGASNPGVANGTAQLDSNTALNPAQIPTSLGVVLPTAVTYAGIQAAATAAAAAGKRVWASGTITTSSTLTITSDADLSQLTINYTGTGVAVQLGSTSAYTNRVRVSLPRVIAANKVGTGWGTVAGTVGVYAVNLNVASEIVVPYINNFETGLYVAGLGKGFAYNTFLIGHLENNKVNLRLSADATGWANQNTFIGGRYGHNSGEGTNVAGTRHILMDAGLANPINNNTWVSPSLEGNTAEFIVDFAGTVNMILNGRWESTTPKVRWQAAAFRNVIQWGYQAHSIVETYGAGANSNAILAVQSRESASGTAPVKTLENESSSANAVFSVLEAGGRAAAADPLTAFAMFLSAQQLRGKRAADANARVIVDFQNGRLYLGNGVAAPAMYWANFGTSGIQLVGANLVFGTDNANDIGAVGANRPRDVRAARVVTPGAAVTGSRPSAVTVGAAAMFYDTTLSKPIWSDGTVWRDAAGTAV